MPFTSAGPALPRWRDVYLVSGARAISVTGDFLAATALALTLQTRGDGGWGVAALFAAATLPMAVLAPLGGRLADRMDSRTLLLCTSLVQAVVCAVLAFADNPVTMVALVAVLASGVAITQPTTSALVPEMVGPENLPRAMSISQTAGAVGMLAGPVLGAVLLAGSAGGGTRLPLLVDAVTYVAIAGAALLIQTRRGGRTPSATPAAAPSATPSATPAAPLAAAVEPAPLAALEPATPAPAWRLRDDRLLVTIVVALVAVVGALVAVEVAELFFVRETLGSSELMYGFLASMWTLGMLVGAWPFGRVRGDDARLVRVFLGALAAVSALIAVSAAVPAALWLAPLYLCGGGLNAALNVLSGVVLGRRIPAAIRGRVFGTLGGLVNAATAAGYVLGGVLMQVAAPRVIIAGTGLVGVALGVLFLTRWVMSPTRDRAMTAGVAPVSYVEQP
jgi:MFS family permease